MVALLIKKLFLAVVFSAIFIFTSVNSALVLICSAIDEPSVSAYSAILINASTNEVVYAKNADDTRSMASTTKIMTAILAIESGKMQDEVEITRDMVGAEGTSIGLTQGYKMTLETLVYGLLLESGNDAANAVAIFLAGTTEDFAVMMNEKAEEIGMTGTNFVTPSGLDDDQHYTTAYDMALLASYAVKNEVFCQICSTSSIQVSYIEPEKYVTFSNHNSFLDAYDGAFGIKTGYTTKSGRCLVTAVEKDGVVLIAVTLNASDDWNDHAKMYDYGFEVTQSYTVQIQSINTIDVYGSVNSSINVGLSLLEYTYSGMRLIDEFEQMVYLPSIIYAPINEGDILGWIELYYEGEVVETIEIYAQEDAISIEETYSPKLNLFEWIKQKIMKWFKIGE